MPSRKFASAVFLALVLGAVLGITFGGLGNPSVERTTRSNTPDVAPISGVDAVSNSSYTRLYSEVIDSVVSVRVDDGGLRSSAGSGFVYDANGHIVTNQHVVGETDQVEVRFSNGEWRTADVIGTDIYTDLAVLEVDRMPDYTEALPVASSDPRIGQRVAALGNPLGLEGSMTHGIVSGLNRSMTTRTNFAIPDTIQTDAAVNPGNSGGPLVSMNGVVVGVNRAKQGDNIGFAISPALIREVVPSLIKTGNVEHPYMGISSVTVTPTVAEVNGIGEPRGVLVVEVLEDGPSQGVLEPSPSSEKVNGRDVPKGGDVILSIEGTRISSNEELAGYLMTRTDPGETVSIRVLRDGEERTVELTLGTRPEP